MKAQKGSSQYKSPRGGESKDRSAKIHNLSLVTARTGRTRRRLPSVMETTSIPALVKVAALATQMFETALELLQDAQALLPAPTLEEIAGMRERKRPLTREAYLLGLLQRVIVGAENLASDLRIVDEEILRNVHEFDLSALEFNAMEEAAARRKTE
jgi:hypothetical protein